MLKEKEIKRVKDEDELSREAIVQDIKHNYFVEASAGSGKTTSLVYRMVSLIEHEVPVDKICTITFTKAAANEFFERFQKLLSIRSGDTPDDSDKLLGKRTDKSKELCQNALANIDLCFLGTIDAFCNMIAHEMPMELKIPTSSSVISKGEYTRIVKEEYNNILKDENNPLHPLAVKFNKCIPHPFDAFVVGINTFSDFRNLKIIYNKQIGEKSFDKYFGDDRKKQFLEVISNLIKPSDNDLYDSNSNADFNRSNAKSSLEKKYNNLKNSDSWDEYITDLEYALKDIKDMDGFLLSAEETSLGGYLKPLEAGSRAKRLKYSEIFKNDIDKFKCCICEYQYSLYFNFILEALEQINKILKNAGKFQFFDFQLYLKDAFKESAMGDRILINHVFERHSYFLIDESQDTNPLQTELFFYLTSTKSDKDWRKMEPKEGSLFIVGDPKQSIYAFRGADVKAYLSNKKIFEDKKELLTLTRNYRSHVSLKQWFNSTFNDLLNYEDQISKEFALEHKDIPIDDNEPTKDIYDGDDDIVEGVYRYQVSSDKDSSNSQIAKLVLDIIQNKKIYRLKYSSRTGQKEVYEDDIKYNDFLIVPYTTKMESVVNAFNKNNIPVVVEGKVNFGDTESFNWVLNLLYLLKEPHNAANFNKVVFSNLFGLTDGDDIQMLNDGFDLNIANPLLDENGINFTNENHKNIVYYLNNLYKKTVNLSFSSTMLYILNDKGLNLFQKTAIKDLENIFYLIEKIKEGEENGSISSLSQFEIAVDLFLHSGDEQRILRFKDKLNRVKIANLHKVKGLQAPIVILSNPESPGKTLKQFVNYEDNPPTIKFSEISNPNAYNCNYVSTDMFAKEQPKWDAYSESEKDRLNYVGATRAEASLIVCEKTDGKGYGYWSKLVSHISDDRILPLPDMEEVEFEAVEAHLGDYHIDEKCHEASLRYISPSQLRVSRIDNKDEIDDSVFDNSSDYSSTLTGTLVHKLMECLVTSRNKYNPNLLIEKILKDYGVEDKIYQKTLQKVAETILSGGYKQLNSTLNQDILKLLLDAKKVWCEVPFSYLSKNGNVVNGIIDVLYVDENDKYHIIDYKTNKQDDVSALEKEYESQLQQYIYALKKMGVDSDAHIYHLNILE